MKKEYPKIKVTPAKMKQLTTNIAAKSELLFEDDLNKRISQINNTNSALAKPAFTRPSQNGRYTKIRYPATPPAIITNNQKTDILFTISTL